MFGNRLIPLLLLAGFFLLAIGAWQSLEADEKVLVWNADDPDLEWGPCPEFLPDDCRIAVLQGNPAEPNADVFFKLQPNTTADHHWHTSAERMVLVSGLFEVDYDGQDPVVMRPGTYAYGPARLPHTARCLDQDPCVLFIAFEKPVDAIPTAERGPGDEH